jgi:hypothetical protein
MCDSRGESTHCDPLLRDVEATAARRAAESALAPNVPAPDSGSGDPDISAPRDAEAPTANRAAEGCPARRAPLRVAKSSDPAIPISGIA